MRERLALGNFRRGSVHGVKFDDVNRDGRQGEKEGLLAGWTIMLDGIDGMGNPVQLQTRTMADDPRTKQNELGMYWFDNLLPGSYEITEVRQEGWVQTVPASGSYTVELVSGEILDGYAFGNHKRFEFAPPTLDVSLISDFPSIRTNVRDEDNPGISAWPYIGPFYPYPQVPLGFKAGLAVIEVNNAQGRWEYSRNSGAMWTTFAGVSPTSAVMLGVEASDRLRFVPHPGFFGVISPGLSVRAAFFDIFFEVTLDGGGVGRAALSSATLGVNAVPEPSAAVLMALGIGAIGYLRSRRHR